MFKSWLWWFHFYWIAVGIRDEEDTNMGLQLLLLYTYGSLNLLYMYVCTRKQHYNAYWKIIGAALAPTQVTSKPKRPFDHTKCFKQQILVNRLQDEELWENCKWCICVHTKKTDGRTDIGNYRFNSNYYLTIHISDSYLILVCSN